MARVAKSYRGPGCPKCGNPLPADAPRTGEHACWTCGQRFALVAFDAPLVKAAVRAADPLTGSPCARHARNQAVASCERCGAFMCGLCRVDSDGKALCAACFDRLGSAGELADARKGYRHYNGMAVHFTVLAIVMWPLAPIFGPLAVFTALRGLKQGKRLGVTLGETGARVAIGLGSLETVAGTLGVLALFGAFK